MVTPFTPVYLMWSLAIISAACYAIGDLIEGPIHHSDKDIGYAFAYGILVIFSAVIALLIFLKLIFLALAGRINMAVFVGPRSRLKEVIDGLLIVSTGALAGLLLTIALANALSGRPIGQGLDLGISIAALLAGFVLLIFSRAKVALVLSTALVSLAILAFIGSYQSDRILSQAQTLAEGRPWCLATSSFSENISDVGDLGFFALRKPGSYPHLGLLIPEDGRLRIAAHWSIRQQSFFPVIYRADPVPTCIPVHGYAAALRRREVDAHSFAFGAGIYALPPALQPRVTTHRMTIQSDLTVGADSVLPRLTERLAMIEGPAEPTIPDDAKPLSMMPNPDEVRAFDLTYPNSLTLAGVDEATGKTVTLTCLSGPYADELCRVRVFEGSVGYEFYLPFAQIENWREAARLVADLFESFRGPK